MDLNCVSLKSKHKGVVRFLPRMW